MPQPDEKAKANPLRREGPLDSLHQNQDQDHQKNDADAA